MIPEQRSHTIVVTVEAGQQQGSLAICIVVINLQLAVTEQHLNACRVSVSTK